MKDANLYDFESKSRKSVVRTARDHSTLSLSRLAVSPVAKEPDLSSALVIFELKALCCIIRAVEVVLQWLRPRCEKLTAGSVPAAEPALSMLPVRLSWTLAVAASTLTHADTHTDQWNPRESFLSLLNEENDPMNHSEHPRWVSPIQMKLMALQWLKVSVCFPRLIG